MEVRRRKHMKSMPVGGRPLRLARLEERAQKLVGGKWVQVRRRED